MLNENPFKVDDILIDREQAFLLYATFCGDVVRTAHALNIKPVDVLRMVDQEGWSDKLRGIIELKNSARPGDVERAINRAINFVQAHRMRMFLERVMTRLTGMEPEEIDDYMFSGKVSTKDGTTEKKLSTRALADLASALEKCHALTYLALNDTVQDRTKRKENDSGETAAGSMHIKIAEAMQKVGASTSPRAQLFDAQIAMGEQRTQRAVKDDRANSPYNQDS